MTVRTGVWIIGALGGVATTVAVGARAIAQRRVSELGLVTATPAFAGIDLVAIGDLVFGGCDVREGNLAESAHEIARVNRSLDPVLIDALRDDFAAIDRERVRGIVLNAGRAIERLTGNAGNAGNTDSGGISGGAPSGSASASAPRPSLRAAVTAIESDLDAFRRRNHLDRVVVVNLASTEPPLPIDPELQTLAGLERVLDADRADLVRSSLLYSYAAMRAGCGYVNFTPSNTALVPGIAELAKLRRVPFYGSDGKTGETLVKSTLAPMFRHRNLKVLTWQGYNILGDRDGEVLADEENLAAKVQSKDKALAQILGYPLHTHVGIDYVPSLHDMKTAWDFIHFEGFLGHRMAMQFIWQGCDSILAAPLVLDLVRLVDFAMRAGEHGALTHLAGFFKSPFGCDEHDFHKQTDRLADYVAQHRNAAGTSDRTGHPGGPTGPSGSSTAPP